MTKQIDSTSHYIYDGIIVSIGALSPWWAGILEPGLRAFVLICTAFIVGYRVWKMFLHFIEFIGLRRKKKSRITDFEKEDEED